MAAASTRARDAFIEEIKATDPREFAMRRVFDAVPLLFRPDAGQETLWRLRMAKALDVDPCGIFLVGSACTGFSLAPEKNCKVFDASSDVDVAVVSSIHFEVAWRYLRLLGAGEYALDPKETNLLKTLRADLAFYGVIPTEAILERLPFGRAWAEALEAIRRDPPVGGRPISVRLYRDSHALVLYQVRSISQVRERLLTPLPKEA